MRGIFGRPSTDCFASYDRATSSWRTSQVSLLETTHTYSRFSGTLPRSGTMRSGRLSEHATLARPTDDIASGSSPIYPPPPATQYGTNQGGGMGRVGPVRESLDTMARRGSWPTPTQGDSKSSGSRNTATSKANPGISLTDAVRGDGGTGRKYPTPDANCWKSGEGSVRRGKGAGGGEALSNVLVSSPGPTAGPLIQRTWPTAQARDGDRRGAQAKRYKDTARSYDLPDAARAAGQSKGQLHPCWVSWLMGFPVGWTAVRRRNAAPASERATQALQALRRIDAEEAIQRSLGGLDAMESAEVLLAFLRELAEDSRPAWALLESQEAFEGRLRELRGRLHASSAPSRRRQGEQRCVEYRDALRRLSREASPRDATPLISRVATKCPDRVDRLKALGNSVVPAVVAWIGERINE
jgi:DNA (cytosine-5)-methyltransferase 1